MDTVFYDRSGKAVAYTSNSKHIYTFGGRPAAYIDRASIYSYAGKHLGWFRDGWIRDHSGACVFFTKDAKGGPAKPVKSIKPVKSVRSVKPVRGVKQVRPARPAKSASWSDLSGPRFFD